MDVKTAPGDSVSYRLDVTALYKPLWQLAKAATPTPAPERFPESRPAGE
ncbi:MAG: hypothetical protein GDA41_07585 [Rhodospirillales bacterium]|nr:hypothetical protein [Rhodospirillales bacterium]